MIRFHPKILWRSLQMPKMIYTPPFTSHTKRVWSTKNILSDLTVLGGTYNSETCTHHCGKNMLNCLQLTCWRSKEACGVTQTFLQYCFNQAWMHSHCAHCTVTVHTAQWLCQKIYICKHVEFGWQLGWSMLNVNYRQLTKFFLQLTPLTGNLVSVSCTLGSTTNATLTLQFFFFKIL